MANRTASDDLQRAIEAGDFARAEKLTLEYRRALDRDLARAGDPHEQAALAQEAIAFLHDRLHLARVMRSHIAAQLASASRLATYSDLSHAGSSWQMDG